MQIHMEKRFNLKEKPDWKQLVFGQNFTDHMFEMTYDAGYGWHDATIHPHQNLELDPSSLGLHYGVSMFEGTKAYRRPDGRINLFRLNKNAERFANTCRRFCVEPLTEAQFQQAILALVDIDRDWVPPEDLTALYIRPFMLATDTGLGVRIPEHLKFWIIMTPVGVYYPEGLNPIKIMVEDEYVRAVRGGTGYVKYGGNYAAQLIAAKKAKERGYTQTLWLDGVERKYIEEVGTMNIMFKIAGEVVTPELGGSILLGVTRDSVLTLLRTWGIPVSERRISIDELQDAAKRGTLEESWGTGTSAVVTPVGEYLIKGEKYLINEGKTGPLTQKLYDALTAIQWGRSEDPFGWTTTI